MRTTTLSNGAVVGNLKISVTITRYDLIAAVCWGLSRNRTFRSKKQIVGLASRLIESQGVSSIPRLMQKHSLKHSVQAESIVSRYLPELKEGVRDLLVSNN